MKTIRCPDLSKVNLTIASQTIPPMKGKETSKETIVATRSYNLTILKGESRK